MSVGERVGRNEAIFREVNERIHELNRGFAFAPGELADFVCECSDESCFAPVRLTLSEYEHVRTNPTHFVIAPGHVWSPEVESVVAGTERYDVVAKDGGAGEIAEDTAP